MKDLSRETYPYPIGSRVRRVQNGNEIIRVGEVVTVIEAEVIKPYTLPGLVWYRDRNGNVWNSSHGNFELAESQEPADRPDPTRPRGRALIID